ncbi:unnamed protein product [Pieris brassicae]|uniref:Uncharacterized protein n=1 Tax=Pieris brassicae TaxID=7116 RepID=A0A9P0XFG9_PIEBR|nr:unnamed protein product [Pieris brassicae]
MRIYSVFTGFQAGIPPSSGGYATTYAAPQQRQGLGTGAAVGLGVGALAAGGLAGYALGGGFSSDSPTREEPQVVGFSESFGGDDWAE